MLIDNERGVTLLAALIVILIVGIVAALVIPQMKEKEKERIQETCRAQLMALSQAQEEYIKQHGVYTDSLEALVPLLPSGMTLTCPLDGATYGATATDSLSYGISCPNGHGAVQDGRPNWSRP